MTKRKAGAYRGARIKHGASRRGAATREYRAWNEMHKRCSPGFDQYEDYAGRGITVCKAWSDFATFLADVGLSPGPGWTLDRMNNDVGYKPGNVRWASRATQSRNRRLCSRRKLDEFKAAKIRALYKSGIPSSILAARFKVVQGTINSVVSGRSWA